VTDIILLAVIVAFFVAGALLVRVLDHMIVHAGVDLDSDSGDDPSGPEPEPGRPGGAR
jgi:hypothetical protein